MSKLVYYFELNEESRGIARAAVVYAEFRSVQTLIKKRKAMIRHAGIHAAVNNPHRIRSIVNTLSSIKNWETLPVPKFERIIAENMCMFSPGGDYYLFTRKQFASKL